MSYLDYNIMMMYIVITVSTKYNIRLTNELLPPIEQEVSTEEIV